MELSTHVSLLDYCGLLFISVELNLNSVQRHFFCQPGPRFLIMIDYFRAEDDDDKYS